MTEGNARYLVRQREAFLQGTPGPDFPGGVGESEHVGRIGRDDVRNAGGLEGERAMGLASLKGERKFWGEMNRAVGLAA